MDGGLRRRARGRHGRHHLVVAAVRHAGLRSRHRDRRAQRDAAAERAGGRAGAARKASLRSGLRHPAAGTPTNNTDTPAGSAPSPSDAQQLFMLADSPPDLTPGKGLLQIPDGWRVGNLFGLEHGVRAATPECRAHRHRGGAGDESRGRLRDAGRLRRRVSGRRGHAAGGDGSAQLLPRLGDGPRTLSGAAHRAAAVRHRGHERLGELEVLAGCHPGRRAGRVQPGQHSSDGLAPAGRSRASRRAGRRRSLPAAAGHHRHAGQLERVRVAQGHVGRVRPSAGDFRRRRRGRHPAMVRPAAHACGIRACRRRPSPRRPGRCSLPSSSCGRRPNGACR